MQEANTFSLSSLFEKGQAEYLGLFLVLAGGAWICLAVLDALNVVSPAYDVCNRVAAILALAVISLYAIVCASSIKAVRCIKEHHRKIETAAAHNK
ncbi:uncharacterized protein NEMAJ01_0289 [Nematocida major]|uniref:uncharacterized protein n=1 Tax=Nematocida major TaxID=1912982 RepID=UPI0020073BD5|nr:uncharacterized protein NEMAJ01_0289 [Nematocida major]KAH9385393.1 hypothetical protein NEMAJ01_0289 [Nematocida major]